MRTTPNSKEYVRCAIRVLKHFGANLTDEQRKKLYYSETQEKVDKYKREIISQTLDDYEGDMV